MNRLTDKGKIVAVVSKGNNRSKVNLIKTVQRALVAINKIVVRVISRLVSTNLTVAEVISSNKRVEIHKAEAISQTVHKIPAATGQIIILTGSRGQTTTVTGQTEGVDQADNRGQIKTQAITAEIKNNVVLK